MSVLSDPAFSPTTPSPVLHDTPFDYTFYHCVDDEHYAACASHDGSIADLLRKSQRYFQDLGQTADEAIEAAFALHPVLHAVRAWLDPVTLQPKQELMDQQLVFFVHECPPPLHARNFIGPTSRALHALQNLNTLASERLDKRGVPSNKAIRFCFTDLQGVCRHGEPGAQDYCPRPPPPPQQQGINLYRVAHADFAALSHDGLQILAVSLHSRAAQLGLGVRRNAYSSRVLISLEAPLDHSVDAQIGSLAALLPKTSFLAMIHLTWLARLHPDDFDETYGAQVREAQSGLTLAMAAFVAYIYSIGHDLDVPAFLSVFSLAEIYSDLTCLLNLGRTQPIRYLSAAEASSAFDVDLDSSKLSLDAVLEMVTARRIASAYNGGFVPAQRSLEGWVRYIQDKHERLGVQHWLAHPKSQLLQNKDGTYPSDECEHNGHSCRVHPFFAPSRHGLVRAAPSVCSTCGDVIGAAPLPMLSGAGDLALSITSIWPQYKRSLRSPKCYDDEGRYTVPQLFYTEEHIVPLPLPSAGIIDMPEMRKKDGVRITHGLGLTLDLAEVVLPKHVNQRDVEWKDDTAMVWRAPPVLCGGSSGGEKRVIPLPSYIARVKDQLRAGQQLRSAADVVDELMGRTLFVPVCFVASNVDQANEFDSPSAASFKAGMIHATPGRDSSTAASAASSPGPSSHDKRNSDVVVHLSSSALKDLEFLQDVSRSVGAKGKSRAYTMEDSLKFFA